MPSHTLVALCKKCPPPPRPCRTPLDRRRLTLSCPRYHVKSQRKLRCSVIFHRSEIPRFRHYQQIRQYLVCSLCARRFHTVRSIGIALIINVTTLHPKSLLLTYLGKYLHAFNNVTLLGAQITTIDRPFRVISNS